MNLNAELAATIAMEKLALTLLNHPVIRAAQQEGERALVASLEFVDSKSLEALSNASHEISIAAMLFAMADPEYPNVLYTELQPRVIDGIALPGSRAMDDNPDTVYRFIPVNGESSYVIEGRIRSDRPIVQELSLLNDKWVTMQNFPVGNLVCDADGTFTIEVDPRPTAGRSNHIQSSAGASLILIRDTLADWSRQLPTLLSVRRLGAPTRPALSEDDLVAVSARYVRDWFTRTIALHQGAVAGPANQFPQPQIGKSMAMLVTQAYSIGRFALEWDQALVITLRLGRAGYAVIPVTNLWGISNNPVNRQASLNTHQAVGNDDGSFTFVLSLKDPGVANWVDPGLPQGFLFLRWAAFDPDYQRSEQPSVESEMVALTDLARHIPATMPMVDAAERCERLAERARTYNRRWIEA